MRNDIVIATAFAVLMVAFTHLLISLPYPEATSQRVMIYNTTGNSTDATGSEEIDWKDLSSWSAKVQNSTTLSKRDNVTSLDYPASREVIILEGAALKGGSAFSPDPATIDTGGTITWINKDSVTHTVTSGQGFSDPDMGKHFDSGLIGGSFKKTIDKAGKYPYFCQVHPQMIGEVVVKSAAPAAETASTTFEGTVDIQEDNTESDNADGNSFWKPVFDFFNWIF